MDAIKLLEQTRVKVYRNVKETGRQLGVGSFGAVVELKIKGEVGKFAGKKIHEVLVVGGDVTLLVRECNLMSQLIHPNVAKFLGVCKLPKSTLPALIMELMDHSLEEVIENTTAAFELTLMTTLSIFIDVAQGLAYLHSRTPQVLHRDLTARNVLLDKDMNAKITDFGNSRIVDETTVSKTMTQAPGTQVYMPPEALDTHAKYSDRLDIFSFGHLALYTLIREFPKDLLPATHMASKEHLVARSEVERRSRYMEKLNTVLPLPDHRLFKLIKKCLHNDSTNRPSAIRLLHMLLDIQGLERGVLYDSGKLTRSKSDLALYRRSMAEDDYEDIEMYTEMDAVSGDKKTQNIISQHSKEGDTIQCPRVHSEANSKGKRTGFMEKRSGGKKRGWRPYTFTLDYEKRTFQYTRESTFGRNQSINLDDIECIIELEVTGHRFPFVVHFRGRHSPWELSVYSQADRKEWKEALLLQQDKIQRNLSYGMLDEDKTKEGGVYEVIPDTVERYTPQPRRTLIEPVYNESSVKAESADNEDDVYEKLIGVLQGFNPNQMDAFTKRLHSVTKRGSKKVRFRQGSVLLGADAMPPPIPTVQDPPLLPADGPSLSPPPLPAKKLPMQQLQQPPPPVMKPAAEHCTPPHPPSTVGPSQLISPPPPPTEKYSDPQRSPLQAHRCLPVPMVPMSPPPPPPPETPPQPEPVYYSTPQDAMLDMDIYPDVDDYDGSEDETENTDGYYSYISDPEAEAESVQKKPTPPPPLPPKSSTPSKHKKHIELTQKKRIDFSEDSANETLLVTEDSHRAKRRPSWAVAKQDTLKYNDLEKLQKEAFSIPLSSLSGITKIGEGKFGEVYSAQMDNTLRQCKLKVAIKLTKKYSSEKVIKDFQNEMNVMSQVCHNNIVTLYGIISEGPLSPAIVMEYLPHGNLQTYLMREKQPVEFLVKCMTDVAMGMDHLNGRGLIHRDLAARNVLVDKDKTCKVSDFGLLREVPKDDCIYISTSRGPSPLRWMAPESIDERIFSPASDVWSYGILQWEMFFPDKMPYHDMEDMQMAARVTSGYFMPIPRRCPKVAGKIMRACWQKEPSNRPSFLLICKLLRALPV